MTSLTNNPPGLAASSSDAFTQDNCAVVSPPSRVNYGWTVNDLARNTLVGRVTITGELVLCDSAAADGSQVPVGVTTHDVIVSGSNSLADSNSAVDADRADVGYYVDGVFNYDVIVKGGNWTRESLVIALDASGAGFGVDQIATASPGTPSD